MQHEEIRQAVRRFAQEQLAPNAARWDREKHFPREALKGLAAMGLYGVAIAEEWGGADGDFRHEAVLHEAADENDTEPVVSDTLRTGYLWKGRVLRPAMVKVRG